MPDKIEFKLERHGNKCELTYREFFTYVPSEIAKIIVPLTKKAWERNCPFLTFHLLNKGIKITQKGKLSEVKAGVEGFLIREAILYVAQNQQEANEIIENLCSERACNSLCGKPDPKMECLGVKIQPNTVREWNERIDREIREKVKKIESTLKAHDINLLQE
jgi:hypothetical protein